MKKVKMVRTFIAIQPPPSVRLELNKIGQQLSKQVPSKAVRWEKPEHTHLTLSFLGETAVSTLPAIKAGLDQIAACHRPFDLQAVAIGCFPNCQQPRVVWAGLDGDLAQLAQLKRAIDEMLQPLGWEAEKRPFNPHFTLGRVKDMRQLADVAWGIEFEEVAVSVTAVTLMESELKPTGPLYTVRHRAKLVGLT